MKVKIIECKDYWWLENDINDFISNHKPENIINIQYAGAATENGTYYSALILYKE